MSGADHARKPRKQRQSAARTIVGVRRAFIQIHALGRSVATNAYVYSIILFEYPFNPRFLQWGRQKMERLLFELHNATHCGATIFMPLALSDRRVVNCFHLIPSPKLFMADRRWPRKPAAGRL